ncbi:MAG: hypothetical protein PHD15_02630 [Clostridia bacterium]|nr:hypothetical protein [Clostridia bacterium]MDD4386643.1 hypothetical protein [Clostridia bacterium]
MKDFKDMIEYVLKNKYVIICVAIVVILYTLGVIEFITKFIVLLLLVAAAIYIGKKIQDNESILNKVFKNKGFKSEDNVYYYQDKESKEKKDSNEK